MTRKPFQHEPMWRRYLRFSRPSPDADVDDEFTFHLQTKTEELIREGAGSPQAVG
jgi:hypothetical protein